MTPELPPVGVDYLKMANLSPVEEHFISKTLESDFALWNALLTVNGIILTAFSILPIVSTAVNRRISLLLVACCFVSLLLVIWNFLVTKKHYLKVGQMLFNPQSRLTEDERKKNIRTENRQYRNVHRREKAALLLLLGESALIGLLLFLAGP